MVVSLILGAPHHCVRTFSVHVHLITLTLHETYSLKACFIKRPSWYRDESVFLSEGVVLLIYILD